MYILITGLRDEKEAYVKTRWVIFSLLAFMVIPLRVGHSESLAEWLTRPRGSPPAITHSFASEKLSHNDKWKIYFEANDPDGDMRQIVLMVNRGRSRSRFNYVGIKKGDQARLLGYLNCFIWSGIGSERNEWVELTLTLFIRDKGGNTSNKVVFPLALSQGFKQGTPPPPFETGGLKALGTIWVDLAIRTPGRDGD
jgi:hypothetical protein